MYCLSVYLIQIQSYRVFSKIAVDHWCLSLNLITIPWELTYVPFLMFINIPHFGGFTFIEGDNKRVYFVDVEDRFWGFLIHHALEGSRVRHIMAY